MNTVEMINQLEIGEVATCGDYHLIKSDNGELYHCNLNGTFKYSPMQKKVIPSLTQELLSRQWSILKSISEIEAFRAFLGGEKIAICDINKLYYAQIKKVPEQEGKFEVIKEFGRLSNSRRETVEWYVCYE